MVCEETAKSAFAVVVALGVLSAAFVPFASFGAVDSVETQSDAEATYYLGNKYGIGGAAAGGALGYGMAGAGKTAGAYAGVYAGAKYGGFAGASVGGPVGAAVGGALGAAAGAA